MADKSSFNKNSVNPLAIDIDKTVLANDNFRTLYYDSPNMQLTTMVLQPGENIGMEVHTEGDQFVRVEMGTGKAIIGNNSYQLDENSVLVIPQGFNHDIINTGNKPLRIYVIYTWQEHQIGE